MNRFPRRLLALVATVLVATFVTVGAYLDGQAEVERLRRGAASDPAASHEPPGCEECVPLPSVQVRAESTPPGDDRAI